MDGFYCVPQTLGLVRGEPKEGAKNRANGEAIMREAMYERASRSPTLDRTRSGKNEYWGKVGVKSLGGDHWAWTKARADEWRSTYTDKNGRERSRRLPRQSVIAIATIVKAPAEVTAGWSEEKREKFFADAANVLKEYDKVFYNPTNTIYRAVHRDEADGCHVHFAHEARDKDGRYCGSRYDAKWRQGLAAAFAKEMRKKGWPVLDPKLTDWERYRSVRKARPGERAFLLDRARCGLEAGTRVAWADPDYRREVDERRRRQGLSVEEHHARMEQAKQLEAAKAEQAAAEQARDDAKAVTAQAVQAKTDADNALGEVQGELEGLGDKVTELTAQRDQLQKEVGDLGQAKADAEREAKEAAGKVEGIFKKAREDAQAEARNIVDAANTKAEGIVNDANIVAQGIVNDAQAKADGIVNDAQAKADGIVNALLDAVRSGRLDQALGVFLDALVAGWDHLLALAHDPNHKLVWADFEAEAHDALADTFRDRASTQASGERER